MLPSLPQATRYPQVTRGGLEPAKITNLSNNDVVKFMFNPHEFTINKGNTWSAREGGTGSNIPQVQFSKGEPYTLDLTLHFDTLGENKDVRDYTDKLWKMMMVDESSRNTTSNMGEPPRVAFEWGRLYFKAVITKIAQTFTLFTEQGMPVRCKVVVSLKQYIDDAQAASQIPGQPPAGSVPATTTVVEGQRMDHIAATAAGGAAGGAAGYRTIAENNNVDNPNNVPPGTTMTTSKA